MKFSRKKVLITLGVVALGAAVVGANFYFKREQGKEVAVEALKKRDLKAIVSASGKIQAKRFVNISADTMGRVTNLAVEEGDRVKHGQFLLQIDPRNLAERVPARRGRPGGHRGPVADAEHGHRHGQGQPDARAAEPEAPARPLGRAADHEGGPGPGRDAGPPAREGTRQRAAADHHAAGAHPRAAGGAVERPVQTSPRCAIESPIDGIVTRRNIEQGEMVMIGTMNNAGTVLLTIADMSVIEAEVEVDETDVPFVKIGQVAEDHDRRHARQGVHGQGDRDRQQPDPVDQHDVVAGSTGDELQGGRAARRADSTTCAPASRARRRSRRRPASRRCRCRSRPWSSAR